MKFNYQIGWTTIVWTRNCLDGENFVNIKHSMDTLMVKCYVKFRCGFMMSLVTVCFGSVLEERV